MTDDPTARLTVVVVNLDGSIVGQPALMARYRPVVVEASDLHDRLRYWSSKEALAELRDRVEDQVGPINDKVILYGSSDFHNLSWLWLSMLDEPVSVIHFDNHTDWVKMPPEDAVHAGSWVRHSFALGHVRKVAQVGVNGDLHMVLVPPTPTGPMTHNFELFETGRLETFPHSLEEATYFGKVNVPEVCGNGTDTMLGTRVAWNTIRRHGIEEIMSGILDRLPTDKVYISIDKDALREEDCFTNFYNWQQGTLSLVELTSALQMIASRKQIVAMDINGDASVAKFGQGHFSKRLFSIKDRKLTASMFSDPKLNALNDQSNLAILQAVQARPKA